MSGMGLFSLRYFFFSDNTFVALQVNQIRVVFVNVVKWIVDVFVFDLFFCGIEAFDYRKYDGKWDKTQFLPLFLRRIRQGVEVRFFMFFEVFFRRNWWGNFDKLVCICKIQDITKTYFLVRRKDYYHPYLHWPA